MSRKHIYTTTALILGGIFLYYLLFSETDQEAINRRLDELATILSITNDKSGATRLFSAAGRAGKAASYATEDATIQLYSKINASGNQRELAQMLGQLIHAVDKSTVSFDNRVIQVDASNESAVVELDSHAIGWKHEQEYPWDNAYTMQWVKIDGEWLVASAKITRDI